MIENPIGIPEADDLLGRISSGAFVLILISALLSAVSVFFRIRRADEQKRAQIKWFAFAVVINLGFIILSEITRLSDVIGVQLHGILFGLVVITLPVATAFAILKYRLWDIDIIIRRTLVYSVLMVSLGLLFFGGVTLLQHAFGALTGTESSPAAIVLSTLGINHASISHRSSMFPWITE